MNLRRVFVFPDLTSSNTRYRVLHSEFEPMGQSSSDTESDEDGDDRINERLDRIVDFLATYLP
jgi:hypothetical protein